MPSNSHHLQAERRDKWEGLAVDQLGRQPVNHNHNYHRIQRLEGRGYYSLDSWIRTLQILLIKISDKKGYS